MPLNPQDIVRKEFREALRGYNQADVDLFLDEVVEEFTKRRGQPEDEGAHRGASAGSGTAA